MFEQSLVESTHSLKTQNRWSIWLSLALQAAVAAAIVALPLLHPEGLGRLSLGPPQLFVPSPPPPPPPPVRVVAHASTASEAPAAAPPAPRLVNAVLHPTVDRLLSPRADGEAPPSPAVTLTGGGMGDASSTGSSLFATAPTGIRVSVASPAKPVKMSSGVTAGLLINPIHADYSAIARSAHAEGTVVIHAIISKTGTIERASVSSGPALLASAALDAVKRARYRPFQLNGEPTEVDTTINVVFRLN